MAMAMGMAGSCRAAAAASSVASRVGVVLSRAVRAEGGRRRLSQSVRLLRRFFHLPTLHRSLEERYRTLRIEPGASEKEVRKAFRQLALQYHPDVCKGSNCRVQFHQINEAYDLVMSSLREAEEQAESQELGREEYVDDDLMRGMNDPSWELWEEWMGWEGAGIRDYSSHINPYI